MEQSSIIVQQITRSLAVDWKTFRLKYGSSWASAHTESVERSRVFSSPFAAYEG